jgi:hypothetical protein
VHRAGRRAEGAQAVARATACAAILGTARRADGAGSGRPSSA